MRRLRLHYPEPSRSALYLEGTQLSGNQATGVGIPASDNDGWFRLIDLHFAVPTAGRIIASSNQAPIVGQYQTRLLQSGDKGGSSIVELWVVTAVILEFCGLNVALDMRGPSGVTLGATAAPYSWVLP